MSANEHDGRGEQLIEDLAVEMDVVPDQYGWSVASNAPPSATPGDATRFPIA